MTQSTTARRLIDAADQLRAAVAPLRFAPPVAAVYQPLDYARLSHSAYLRRFATGPKRVLLLGMNPGPWGMAQTGIPFGEVPAVRDWMGITEPIGTPDQEHPKRPIEGLSCTRSEVSGRRLWGLMARRFGSATEFFRDHFVANYCPLVFMEESGRNRTPDKLPAAEREPLYAACDQWLRTTITLLKPQWVVGVGGFARSRIDTVLSTAPSHTGTGPRALTILHPSPANPRANRDWEGEVVTTLTEAGVW
ncbi:MAG: single-strand selective monofunctional uracil-DNA glycosylase [Spirochaetaceae bacterium]|nr:MAG: single-strand selective monofunctional uracil-DNA glycosylase [Spirochaetaceae bacterium]